MAMRLMVDNFLVNTSSLGAPGLDLDPIGFTEGDRTHRL